MCFPGPPAAFFLGAKGSVGAAPKVAALLARELGCNSERDAKQFGNFSPVEDGYIV